MAPPTFIRKPAGGSNSGAASGDGNGLPAGETNGMAPPRSTSGLADSGCRSLVAIAAKVGSAPLSVPDQTVGRAEPAGNQLLLPLMIGKGRTASVVRMASTAPPPTR